LLVQVDACLHWVMWQLATRRELHGFSVGVSRPHGGEQSTVFSKVGAALERIETHDPRRLARIRRCVQHLYVSGTGSPYLARWVHPFSMCMLTVDWVLRAETRPAGIACAIVHEATHARLWRFGYQESIRHRIERICYKEEEAFARRLPDAADLADRAQAAQQRPQAFYSHARLRKRSLAAARGFGIPGWVVRLLSWLVRTCAAFGKAGDRL
jgi:hypothetical protein